MSGLFITFEGTECSGKSTQIQLLAQKLEFHPRTVRTFREPGGTAIGEEIRHTLQHSQQNQGMTPETELLLMNASRAQLVREKIRPALAAGEVVLCDRFYDSTIAYQGFGRQIDLATVHSIVSFAVGDTRPHLTFLLQIPLHVSEYRRRSRQNLLGPARDRIEEADREFFERVERGFRHAAEIEPQRVQMIDATPSIDEVAREIWRRLEPWLCS